ncbi:Antirepressor regulating drug resistance, predicted signal transduction N-terminal membrane component [Alteromonadaceae bacterium Bs31]|nr:Antirepressor regulating drug resistance, predicted signal transduction N-terminal membrane component [Alteromonadaceae bacterium Bs31]
MNALFDGSIAYAFAWTTIHSLWQCALVALGLYLFLKINRKQSASARYVMGLGALLLCSLISISTFFHYYNQLASAEALIAKFGTELSLGYSGGVWERFYLRFNDNIGYIMLFWLVGFSIKFYLYVQDFINAFTLKYKGCSPLAENWQTRVSKLANKLGIDKKVIVKYSQNVSSICIVGHLKPIILLPIGLFTHLSNEEVEALILHELGHIRRNDYLINAVQCFIKTLYFFNPAALWISNVIDRERENACDDIAVQYCGNPALYARSLSSVAALEFGLQSVLAAKKSPYSMLPRVQRLFANSSGVSKSFEQMISALCLAVVIVAMNVSANEFDLPQVNGSVSNLNTATSATVTLNDLSADTALMEPEKIEPSALTLRSHKVLSEQRSKTTNNVLPTKLQATPQSSEEQALNALSNRQATTELTPKLHAEETVASNTALHYAIELAEAKPQAVKQPVQLAEAKPEEKKAAVKTSKLEAMDNPHFNEFYVSSTITMPATRQVFIEDISLQFADSWRDDFRTSAQYRKSISTDYSDAFREELIKHFKKAGWSITKERNKGAVILNAKLIDVYIFHPQTIGITDVILTTVGQAGVELLFKSPNEEPFMKIVDYRSTSAKPGGPVQANKATNFHYFRKLMGDWATVTEYYLDAVISILEQQAQNKQSASS